MPNDPNPRPTRRKSSSEMLDELLEQQRAGTFVDPVEEARRTLGEAGKFSNRIKAYGGDDAEIAEVGRLREGARTLPVAVDALRGAALPAAFLGGPVGMASGGYLALEALKGAYDDPTPMNIGMAGLMALPVAKGLRGAKTLKPPPRMAIHGPSREPGFYRTGASSRNPLEGEKMMFPRGPKTESPYASSPVSRMRNTEDELLEGVQSAPLAHLDRTHTGFMQKNASQPASLSAIDELISGARNELTNVPKGKTPSALDDFADDAPKMARDRIDPALRKEAQEFRKGFGFKKLPKISRAENGRIAANIRRARRQD